jgi:hypothetical protein
VAGGGVDRRHAAREEPRRLGEFRRHHPLRLLLPQGRAREDVEADTACAEILAALLALHPDVAEQSREQPARGAGAEQREQHGQPLNRRIVHERCPPSPSWKTAEV